MSAYQEAQDRAETIRDRRATDLEELKDLAAQMWREGLHNVLALSRVTGLARTTLYRALRDRGIEPMHRHCEGCPGAPSCAPPQQ